MCGLFSSKPPPSPKTFTEPWRKISWGTKERDLQFVKDYQPHKKNQQIKILLHGPVGSGKSSFINSVDSMLKGRIANRALANATSQKSFTVQFTTYKIQKGTPETFYPFTFSDIMGLGSETDGGVSEDDIKLAMKGHVKDNYKFNPASALSQESQSYNKDPNPNDHIHVLVCVVDASKVHLLNDKYMDKLKNVRLAARDLKIPQIAILTHIDEACPEIKADIKNVYKSKSMKEKMEQLNVSLGITLNCIFPVKNYHSEIDTDDDIDVLILSALRHIINSGEDFANSL
uniref:interferon-induced protein 44-like n=1 Tax=Semicossyphus pulcher TaxID=241346 RepID=UPI0037E70E46